MNVFSTTLLSLLLILFSCNKFDSEGTIEGEYIESSSIETDSKILFPVYISGDIETEVSAAIAKRSKERVGSTDLAMVAFITANEYTTEFSESFCDSNKVLVVLKPSEEILKGYSVKSEEQGNGVLFVAYNADREHCVVPMPVDGLTYAESINGLVEWVNTVISNDMRDANPESIFEKCFISHNYNYELRDKAITHVVFSKVDKLSGNGVVELGLLVYPLHGFGVNGNTAMDYYIVESTLSIVSDKMYSGNFIKKHGGVKARICGFYWKRLHSDISIVDASGNAVGQFVQTPSPETVSGSKTYSSGWSFSLSGAVTGGTTPAATLGGGVSHSSTTSRTINDCDIISNHSGSTVSYNYVVNKLPSYNSAIKINPPQAISTKTATFYSTWIWAVPTADNNSSKEYYVKYKLSDFVYGASYLYSSSADYNDLEFAVPNYEAKIAIGKPSRYSTGKFMLINTENNTHISNIRLKSTTHPEYPEILIKDQYAFGGYFEKYIPTGEYTLECDIMKNGESAFTTYKYTKGFKVLAGGTVKLASGFGFEKK